MFAAGLLLGFSMFAHVEPVPEVDSAFQNAIAVLERLAQLSPQARHYYEILSTLADAIATRRQQLGTERRKRSSQYVSQIFTADLDGGNSALSSAHVLPSAGEAGTSMQLNATSTAGLGGMTTFDFNASSLDGLAAFPSQSEDAWGDLQLMSDNLYIDWEGLWDPSLMT